MTTLKDKFKNTKMTLERELASEEDADVKEAKKEITEEETRMSIRIQKSKLEDFKFICKEVYKSDMSKEIMRLINEVLANNRNAISSRKK